MIVERKKEYIRQSRLFSDNCLPKFLIMSALASPTSLHLKVTLHCFTLVDVGSTSPDLHLLISPIVCETEKDPDKTPAPRGRAPSLAETEEALAQAVWCWAGIATLAPLPRLARNSIPSCSKVSNFSDFPVCFSDSSYSLLADDVLGSYLMCPHPKNSNFGSLIVRAPSGLVTHLVENTRKGKFLLEVTVAQTEGLRGKGSLCTNVEARSLPSPALDDHI